MADWDWPAANDEPVFDGTYIGAHPTRYNWHPDVEQVARSWVDWYYEQNNNNWGVCWANTYVDHPPGWGRDTTSVDFWGYDRGSRIAYEVGQEIVGWIFNDPNPPWIEWIIWQGWWWVDGWDDWYPYPDFDLASDAQHMNHVHITFYHPG